jgi:TonB dependent receptor/TonB-dependent Receptor Plug Domain
VSAFASANKALPNKQLLRYLWTGTAIGLMLTGPVRAQTDSQASTQQTAPSTSSESAPSARAKVESVTVTGTLISGPTLSANGNNDYSITDANILNLPAGDETSMTDVLSQMPGVGIDQNQQVHIRDTQGSQFQYEINGSLIPLDINTNPPFISMINPLMVKSIDLLDGILPSQYSYAMGGVVNIQTKDGCEQPGGSATIYAGQRGMVQPSMQYAGCSGNLSYYSSVLYSQNNMAFSSATPGPNAIHNQTNQGQTFNTFSYALNTNTKLNLIVAATGSDNQLPNVADLAPQFTLANANTIPSADINSYLNFRDYLGVISLSGSPTRQLSYQISYAIHSISEQYLPDDAGELIYQGVASQTTHKDFDNTFQGDLTYILGQHSIGAGLYFGAYDVTSNANSLVFPVDASGAQSSDAPVNVVNDTHAMNLITGVYVNDLWQISPEFRLNVGLRWDGETGYSPGSQFDPTINLTYIPTRGTTLHAGAARYFQVPSLEGISPGAPAAYAGTTGQGPPGVTNPLTEDDWEWDAGIVQVLTPELTISEDNFFEITRHYLDAGQFGVVPIFAPFNYNHGQIWGSEIAINYKNGNLSAYGNITLGRNIEKGVATGQYNFSEPGELEYIDTNYIVLDHQALLGITTGVTYDWKPYKFSVDTTYNDGLRTGFANLEPTPNVFQVNAGIERTFQIDGVGLIRDRLTVLNVLDRINLIRPFGGLGVFQSAYGPRLSIFDALTVPL